jgi:hypothetical protein
MNLRELLRDPCIAQARVTEDVENVDEHGYITQTKAEEMKQNLLMLKEPDDDSDEDDTDCVPTPYRYSNGNFNFNYGRM